MIGSNASGAGQNSKIRVLIVDDSAIVRKIVGRALSRDPLIEVVGTAADAYEARDKILDLKPDVVSLDIEMPRMDGLTFLKILMKHHPVPVVIVSSLTQSGSAKAFEAMEAGAVEVLGKPANTALLPDFETELVHKVKSAALTRSRSGAAIAAAKSDGQPRVKPEDQIILFGASTGGIEALKAVLSQLPRDLPPICIVQHIPAYISARFASRLDELCDLEVREAENGDSLRRGLALVAPGGFHLLLKRTGGMYQVALEQSERVNYQRPSVDVLFNSAAICAGANAISVLLTGMGRDGADGMLALRKAGARTIVQDEATCTVYGMPRAAVELGAAELVLPLDRIGSAILNCVRSSCPTRDHGYRC